MGSLILCHRKHAVRPYDITRIHRKIYTIEELCYYLCNNLYLIDYTIMNEQLCLWLEEELGITASGRDASGYFTDKGIHREICADHSVGFQYLQ